MAQIIVKNGLEKDLPKAMSKGTVGEPIFTTDTEKFFVTNGTKVVEIGATDPDVMEHIKTLQDTKVDKVSGKGLSTNDYTTAEKNKLAGITAGANNYVHPTDHPASMIKFTDGKTFQQKLDDGSLRGPQGPAGVQGPQGIQGPKGDTGTTGPQGPAGTAGAKGNTGTSMRFKGAWSSATTYVCDANYVDIVTSGGNTYRCKANHTNQPVSNATYWELIAQKGATGATGSQGPQGVQGPKGDTGATGPAGANGFTWRPSVDSAGLLTWTNNGSTTTPTQVNIRGPQGPTGATGAKGETGSQGPQGIQGPQGPAGPNTLTTSTTTSGFTNGHYLYNNNGTVAAKAIPTASTSAAGIVQLTSDTNSTSTTLAATASAVKAAYDLAAGKANASHSHSYLPLSGGTLTGNLTISTILNASAIQVSNKQMIAADHNTVYLGNQIVAVTIQANSNPRVQVGTGAFHTLYHTGNKPTPAEIGALPTTGGSVGGYLKWTAEGANGENGIRGGNGDAAAFETCNLDIFSWNGIGFYPTAGGKWGNGREGRSVVIDPRNGIIKVKGDIEIEGLGSLKSSVSSGKNAIASAITAKGVAASGSDSHATLANKIGQINVGGIDGGLAVNGGDRESAYTSYSLNNYTSDFTNAATFTNLVLCIESGKVNTGYYATRFRVNPTSGIIVCAEGTWRKVMPGSNALLYAYSRDLLIFNPSRTAINITVDSTSDGKVFRFCPITG